jgi:hypothetical protein
MSWSTYSSTVISLNKCTCSVFELFFFTQLNQNRCPWLMKNHVLKVRDAHILCVCQANNFFFPPSRGFDDEEEVVLNVTKEPLTHKSNTKISPNFILVEKVKWVRDGSAKPCWDQWCAFCISVFPRDEKTKSVTCDRCRSISMEDVPLDPFVQTLVRSLFFFLSLSVSLSLGLSLYVLNGTCDVSESIWKFCLNKCEL